MMRRGTAQVLRAFAVAIITTQIAGSASAQIAPLSPDTSRLMRAHGSHASKPQWRFAIAPYAWMSSLQAQTGVRDLSADVDVPFYKFFNHLNFAAMGTFEVGYGPFVGIVDGVYSSVSVDHTASLVPAQPKLDLTMKSFVGEALVGYSFTATRTVAIDLLAGTRFWVVDASLSTQLGAFGRTRTRRPSWADVVGGARIRWRPADRWHVNVYGDGGAGGSRGTAQAIGTAGYDVSSRWSVFLAYRYLYDDIRRNEYFYKGHFDGPVIGAAYHW